MITGAEFLSVIDELKTHPHTPTSFALMRRALDHANQAQCSQIRP
jgi:hypothetical protein